MSHASRQSAALAALRRGRARGGSAGPAGARGLRRAARPFVVAAAAAVVGLAGVSRPAHAVSDYELCLRVVDRFHSGCLQKSDGWVGDRACDWLGGMGILACAAAEAARHLARGITPPVF